MRMDAHKKRQNSMLNAFFLLYSSCVLYGLEPCCEQTWRDHEREPSPTGSLTAIALFQTVHRLCTKHHGVACREGDILRKAVLGSDIDAMPQRAIQIVQSCRHGQVVIGRTAIEFGEGTSEGSYEGILQTRGKTVDVGALIEIVHHTIELGA